MADGLETFPDFNRRTEDQLITQQIFGDTDYLFLMILWAGENIN